MKKFNILAFRLHQEKKNCRLLDDFVNGGWAPHQHTTWSWIGPPFRKWRIGPWSICMLPPPPPPPNPYGLIGHLRNHLCVCLEAKSDWEWITCWSWVIRARTFAGSFWWFGVFFSFNSHEALLPCRPPPSPFSLSLSLHPFSPSFDFFCIKCSFYFFFSPLFASSSDRIPVFLCRLKMTPKRWSFFFFLLLTTCASFVFLPWLALLLNRNPVVWFFGFIFSAGRVREKIREREREGGRDGEEASLEDRFSLN